MLREGEAMSLNWEHLVILPGGQRWPKAVKEGKSPRDQRDGALSSVALTAVVPEVEGMASLDGRRTAA